MDRVVQAVVYGLTIGSAYALVAAGYSIVFATTRIVNFAQGTLVVVGGYLAWWLYTSVFGGDVTRPSATMIVVLVLAMLLTALVGLAVDLVAVAPLGRFDPVVNLSWLVTTFAAGILLQELVSNVISNTGQTLPPLVSSVLGWRGSVVADVAIQPSDALLVVATLATVGTLVLFERRTKVGRAFHAVAQDRQAAALMGINPSVVVMMSFAIAGALAGLSAVLVAPRLLIRFNISLNLGVLGFVAAVLGGLGSIPGAVLGGYAVAFVEGVVGSVTPETSTYRPLAVFALFVLILALRPTGLLGRPQTEKV